MHSFYLKDNNQRLMNATIKQNETPSRTMVRFDQYLGLSKKKNNEVNSPKRAVGSITPYIVDICYSFTDSLLYSGGSMGECLSIQLQLFL